MRFPDDLFLIITWNDDGKCEDRHFDLCHIVASSNWEYEQSAIPWRVSIGCATEWVHLFL